ncbi:DUF58 domain-containing protein [Thalassotalea agarivorans]|uniref:Uncharacterized protein n=1 Tax=Thalassotalea agarivorans TaxID=349064 RepID=A0A1I0EVE9_THASX|nr:DUF58 domain-containing protein [Thalassotalea agarivorans]SET49607.1 Protein of unknown function DUF58 [Thalassotalea agarivorans]
MLTSLKKTIDGRFESWLKRRVPQSSRHQLSSKNIFIFPSGFGFSYLALVILIFLLGTNYQNNIIVLFSYLMLSLFLTCMFATFNNMAKLSLEFVNAPLLEANKKGNVTFKALSANAKQGIRASFREQSQSIAFDLHDQEHTTIEIPVEVNERGEHIAQRVKLYSRYPLGLFNCWSYLAYPIQLIVFPEPIEPSMANFSNSLEEAEQGKGRQVKQSDEFYQFKAYEQGMPLTHVAWKQVAKGGDWQVRENQSLSGNDDWITLDSVEAGHIEAKLAKMTYLVIDKTRKGHAFGFRLGETILAVQSGEQHLQACLTAIARY